MDSTIEQVEVPAAYRMLGVELEGGWIVTQPLTYRIDPRTGLPATDAYGSGGNFSVGYVVERAGQRAFLKAINLIRIKGARDIIKEMTRITDTVNFEREIHRICGTDRMTRVVLAIDNGQVTLGPNTEDVVPYLILELADGDVRRQLRRVDAAVLLAWKLRAMHHTATGLMQLHKRGIAHQDVKPSNIMGFDAGRIFKVGDFGRSARLGAAPPHEEYPFAGDPTYAPPELLYGQLDPNWQVRRIACDLHLLGSMLCFFVMGHGTTPLLMNMIDVVHRPIALRGHWTGPYSDVLPYVRTAMTEVAALFAAAAPAALSDILTTTLIELCEPDPAKRGHPRARAQVNGSKYALERYVSLFNELAERAFFESRRVAQ